MSTQHRVHRLFLSIPSQQGKRERSESDLESLRKEYAHLQTLSKRQEVALAKKESLLQEQAEELADAKRIQEQGRKEGDDIFFCLFLHFVFVVFAKNRTRCVRRRANLSSPFILKGAKSLLKEPKLKFVSGRANRTTRTSQDI